MRRAYNGSVWRDDSLDIIAVNLGADFCAEHEWGIAGIKHKFGIAGQKSGVISSILGTDQLGIDARKVTQKPESLVRVECELEVGSGKNKKSKTVYGIGLRTEYLTNLEPAKEFDHYIKSAYFDPQKEEVLGFWAESRFLFFLESARDIADFEKAFDENDIAIWTGSSGPFKNGGLVIAIASRLPEKFINEMREVDEDSIKLKKAAESTGIYETLKKAGCEYYALSPRWKDESKKEVVFWLNPQQQDRHNYGWYGVDELKQWAKGSGPIIKEKVQ